MGSPEKPEGAMESLADGGWQCPHSILSAPARGTLWKAVEPLEDWVWLVEVGHQSLCCSCSPWFQTSFLCFLFRCGVNSHCLIPLPLLPPEPRQPPYLTPRWTTVSLKLQTKQTLLLQVVLLRCLLGHSNVHSKPQILLRS